MRDPHLDNVSPRGCVSPLVVAYSPLTTVQPAPRSTSVALTSDQPPNAPEGSRSLVSNPWRSSSPAHYPPMTGERAHAGIPDLLPLLSATSTASRSPQSRPRYHERSHQSHDNAVAERNPNSLSNTMPNAVNSSTGSSPPPAFVSSEGTRPLANATISTADVPTARLTAPTSNNGMSRI
jgi:hypothetical protein